jgi:fructokinase
VKLDSAFPVVAFGELLWDLLPSGAVLGGAPANYACCAQQLGLQTALISSVGGDELGQRALCRLADLKLETHFVQRHDRLPTGTVVVAFSAENEPEYSIAPNVAYDQITTPPETLSCAEQAELVYYGTLAQRCAASRKSLLLIIAAAKRAVKFLDLNLRADCWSEEAVRCSLQHADIVKLNYSETQVLNKLLGIDAATVWGFCQALAERYALRATVVTLGSRGAAAWSIAEGEAYSAGRRIAAVDTVGAGDAFSAAFSSRVLNGAPLQKCCEFGCLFAAAACLTAGGMTSISESHAAAVQDCSRVVAAEQGALPLEQ